MIAVEYLNVHPGFTHATRQFTKLARLILIESLHQDITHRDNTNPRSLKCTPRSVAIVNEKMGHTAVIGDPGAAAFDADAGASERFPHLAECARTVFQFNRKVLQRLFPFRSGMRTEHHVEHGLPRFTAIFR